MKKMISVIIPIFNEERTLGLLHKKVTESLKHCDSYNYELIFINDGSHDNSWAIILNLATYDCHVKALDFSRNFGHQMALTAGYDYASGDAIITMDADLQDPPQLLIEMIKAWEKGFAIVYARRANRIDSFFKKITALLYYKFLDTISDVKIPRNVGDFRLIDKKVLTALKECREKSRYLRGMVAWTGFKHTFIDFDRPNRFAGVTGYTWKKMFKLAFDGLTGFSLFPLKLAAYAGLFVITTGSLMFSYITLDAFMFNTYYPLFKWLTTVIYISMGVQFLLLWLLGEYIGRIHEQQKNRPLYIIDETINITTDTPTQNRENLREEILYNSSQEQTAKQNNI